MRMNRLGNSDLVVSAVGADLYGEMVLRQSAAAGIDISEVLTVPGEASSCYISVLDQKGDMLVAMSDMGILSHVTPELVRSLGERLRGAAAVVCDPCLPSETVAAVIREAGDTPVFLDPVSTSYARKVRPLAGGLFCLKPNRIELGVLADMETDSPEGIEVDFKMLPQQIRNGLLTLSANRQALAEVTKALGSDSCIIVPPGPEFQLTMRIVAWSLLTSTRSSRRRSIS